jgi:hypothetical protein
MELAIELVLRIAAGVAVTGAAVYLWVELRRGNVQPRFVWAYTLATLVLTLVLRWFFLAFALGAFPDDVSADIQRWQAATNQALSILISICFILLIRGHIVGQGRRG